MNQIQSTSDSSNISYIIISYIHVLLSYENNHRWLFWIIFSYSKYIKFLLKIMFILSNLYFLINYELTYFSKILNRYESHIIEKTAVNSTVLPGDF